MSYPRKIHTLVVEDDLAVAESYRDILHRLPEQFERVEPRCVRSVADAESILDSPTILHLLILDLGLPLKTRGEAMAGIDPGTSLLKRAAERDRYPIPAVVVISGRLGIGKNVTELDDQLRRSFWHGEVITKGDDVVASRAIERAMKAIQLYCDVGIHVRDAGGRVCPSLSPREEDMLRRCVLRQQGCLGLDLRWWGEYEARGSGDSQATKVLTGHFLLDRNMDPSHTSFFKFRSADVAAQMRSDAEIMGQKLSHIKVLYAAASSTRSLLVTQKVGPGAEPPISLSEYLRRDPKIVQQQIPRIVAAISAQLDRLGKAYDEQWPTKRLLWKWLDRDKLAQACSKFGSGPDATTILAAFDHFHASETPVFVNLRPCTHGDLNATNIALDENAGQAEAYIFDAEGVHPDVSARDFAMLEVTSLLHHALDGGSLVEACADCYSTFVKPPANLDYAKGSPLVRNTRTLIAEIRRHALRSSDESIYAVMILDVALQQLGGLVVQGSGNKIVNPKDAAALASHAASWCARFANSTTAAKTSPGTTAT